MKYIVEFFRCFKRNGKTILRKVILKIALYFLFLSMYKVSNSNLKLLSKRNDGYFIQYYF